jgi:predicted deacylase
LKDPSARQPNETIVEYPVEIELPDLAPWRDGGTNVPFVHSFQAAAPGPHLLVTALIHGNEPAGAVALVRLLRRGIRPRRGKLTLAFANVAAYLTFDRARPRASRWIDEDMNRLWDESVLAASPSRSVEARRAAQLLPHVCAADYLLDLHSTQHPNEPLVLAGPLERSRRLARTMGLAELVVIDRGHAQGRRMRDFAGFGDPGSAKTALLIECGQHWAAVSAEVAYAATLRMLERLGMLPDGFAAPPALELPAEARRFVEITMAVTIKRRFTFALPLRGGEVIARAGTVLGHDGDEPVVTPHDDSFVLMPSQRLSAGLTAVRIGRFVPAPAPADLPA